MCRGAVMPNRTLSPRMSTTVIFTSSPIIIVSSRCLESTSITGYSFPSQSISPLNKNKRHLNNDKSRPACQILNPRFFSPFTISESFYRGQNSDGIGHTGGEGIGPSYTAPKAVVLPLDDPPTQTDEPARFTM